MKSKNIFLVLLFVLGTISCEDKTKNRQKPVPPQPEEPVVIVIDKERISRNQTDKSRILNSLIRYNYAGKNYLLDLSEEDAEKLGISAKDYSEGKKRIEQMNKANIEHL